MADEDSLSALIAKAIADMPKDDGAMQLSIVLAMFCVVSTYGDDAYKAVDEIAAAAKRHILIERNTDDR